MYLYLIRHGIAIERLAVCDSNRAAAAGSEHRDTHDIESDELRSLTKVGRNKVERVAEKLLSLELTFDLIITSPLVRARQTAEIFIHKKLSPQLEISDDLKPQGRLEDWLNAWNARIDRHKLATVALVGHDPDLSEWAELLVFGNISHNLILKKSGIIGLKFADRDFKLENKLAIGTGQLYCSIPPKMMI